MVDFEIIKEKKGNYESIIELHKNIPLDKFGKYKIINAGFIRLSQTMLNKLKKEYCYES